MDLFLTGATGAVGGSLLRHLLAARPDSSVHVLLRAETSAELQARLFPILAGVSEDQTSRVLPVSGDVMLDDLGLGPNCQDLIGRISEIYHVAASTSFCQTMEQASQTNLSGTRHVIDFARAIRKAGNPVRLHHVSTAYVSGTRTGHLREDELESGQQFFNYYEWSKFEAEREVRAAGLELPVTVYRPGIIVGDSRTGHTSRFHGIYQILRAIDLGFVDWLPCNPDFQLDLAPVDYVTEAIVRLSQLSESANRTFHLTAGPGNTLPLDELVEIYAQQSAARHSGNGRPSRPLRFLPTSEDVEGVGPEGNGASNVWKRFSHYVPYVTCQKTFDNSATRAALPDFHPPACREYLPKAVRYALECGFVS